MSNWHESASGNVLFEDVVDGERLVEAPTQEVARCLELPQQLEQLISRPVAFSAPPPGA